MIFWAWPLCRLGRPRVVGIDWRRRQRFLCAVGRMISCDRRRRQGIIRIRPDNGPRFGNGDRDSALDGAVHALILNSPQSVPSQREPRTRSRSPKSVYATSVELPSTDSTGGNGKAPALFLQKFHKMRPLPVTAPARGQALLLCQLAEQER